MADTEYTREARMMSALVQMEHLVDVLIIRNSLLHDELSQRCDPETFARVLLSIETKTPVRGEARHQTTH